MQTSGVSKLTQITRRDHAGCRSQTAHASER